MKVLLVSLFVCFVLSSCGERNTEGDSGCVDDSGTPVDAGCDEEKLSFVAFPDMLVHIQK